MSDGTTKSEIIYVDSSEEVQEVHKVVYFCFRTRPEVTTSESLHQPQEHFCCSSSRPEGSLCCKSLFPFGEVFLFLILSWKSEFRNLKLICCSLQLSNGLSRLFTPQCRRILTDNVLMKRLKAANFDVVITENFDFCGIGTKTSQHSFEWENFYSDCWHQVIKAKSSIVASTTVIYDDQYSDLGIPHFPSFIPGFAFIFSREFYAFQVPTAPFSMFTLSGAERRTCLGRGRIGVFSGETSSQYFEFRISSFWVNPEQILKP